MSSLGAEGADTFARIGPRSGVAAGALSSLAAGPHPRREPAALTPSLGTRTEVLAQVWPQALARHGRRRLEIELGANLQQPSLQHTGRAQVPGCSPSRRTSC